MANDDVFTADIPFERSRFTRPAPGFRQQTNVVTAFLDASFVYGSDSARAVALRAGVDGLLATSAGNLLPFNTFGLTNDNPFGVPDASMMVGGDVRASENPGLLSLQTIFLREHNRRACELKAANPGWDDFTLFEESRRWVIALVSNMVLYQWLPVVLDEDPPAWTAYNPAGEPDIINYFSTAVFRYGHSQINSDIVRLNADGTPTAGGPLHLKESFFNAAKVVEEVYHGWLPTVWFVCLFVCLFVLFFLFYSEEKREGVPGDLGAFVCRDCVLWAPRLLDRLRAPSGLKHSHTQ